MLKPLQILLPLLILLIPARAQPWSLLIKGGCVIEPQRNSIDTLDVAVSGGRIAGIGKHLDPKKARKVIDVHGAYVTPGLIDIHTHVFFGDDPEKGYDGGRLGLIPDSFSFRSGITTIVDAGSSGWRDFKTFKTRVIDHSKTRVLAFLNIVGAGMRGRPYELDTTEMRAGPAAAMAKQYKNDIVGFKVAHYRGGDWCPVDSAVQAGKMTGLPVMLDFGSHYPPLSIEQLFTRHLRSGDIFTHCFAALPGREAVVDTTKSRLKLFVKQAQQRGVCFDVGYGEISFAFSQAVPAFQSGFLPNSISTDIHANTKHDLLDILSTFLALGVDMPTVIRLVTVDPAKEIHRPELGILEAGGIADISIIRVSHGDFNFADHTGRRIAGGQKLECALTIKDGNIVFRNL